MFDIENAVIEMKTILLDTTEGQYAWEVVADITVQSNEVAEVENGKILRQVKKKK